MCANIAIEKSTILPDHLARGVPCRAVCRSKEAALAKQLAPTGMQIGLDAGCNCWAALTTQIRLSLLVCELLNHQRRGDDNSNRLRS